MTRLHDIELAVQTEIPIVEATPLRRAVGRPRRGRTRRTCEPAHAASAAARASALARRRRSPTASRWWRGSSPARAKSWPRLTKRSCSPRSARRNPARRTCSRTSTSRTGGQLYELIAGHDRFVADIRPLMDACLARSGQALGICCHPYDLCTELIARELGVIVTDAYGAPARCAAGRRARRRLGRLRERRHPGAGRTEAAAGAQAPRAPVTQRIGAGWRGESRMPDVAGRRGRASGRRGCPPSGGPADGYRCSARLQAGLAGGLRNRRGYAFELSTCARSLRVRCYTLAPFRARADLAVHSPHAHWL